MPHLTVAENIFLGREPLNRFGLIDYGLMNRNAAALLEQLDLAVPPTTIVSSLRVGQQQVVEIAKALSGEAKVLIMDEPTSAITEHEIEVLFGIIDELKAQRRRHRLHHAQIGRTDAHRGRCHRDARRPAHRSRPDQRPRP